MQGFLKKIGEIYTNIVATKRRYRVGAIRQIVAICTRYCGKNRLGVMDHYDHHLFDHYHYSEHNPKQNVVGWRAAKKMSDCLNAAGWKIVATDKVLLDAILRGHGIETPRIQAVVNNCHRTVSGSESLWERDEIEEFLVHRARYPLFGKPATGHHGRNTMAIKGIASDGSRLIDDGDNHMSIDDVVERMRNGAGSGAGGGYLLQERVKQGADMVRIVGRALSTIRVIVLVDRKGSKVFRVAWRIPAGANYTDNFDGGNTGNIVAGVDPKSGEVVRAIRGIGITRQECSAHPDTGQDVVGITLPEWVEIRSLCLRASRILPMLQWQHWDVAVGERGPMMVELNCEGGPTVPQIANGAGLLDDELREFVRTKRIPGDRVDVVA